MLCSACQRIFRGRLILNDKGFSKLETHHMTTQSFADAIDQKCYICISMLLQYQAHRKGTLGPLQLAEMFKPMVYRFITEDDFHPGNFWIHSGEGRGITWYDDSDLEWHTSCN